MGLAGASWSLGFALVLASAVWGQPTTSPATEASAATQPASQPRLDAEQFLLRPPATRPSELPIPPAPAVEQPTSASAPAASPAPVPSAVPSAAESQPVAETQAGATTQPAAQTQPVQVAFAPTPTPIPVRQPERIETPAIPTATPAPTATPYQPLPPDFSQNQIAEVLRRDLPVNRPLLPKIPEDYRFRTIETQVVQPGQPPVLAGRLLREGDILTDRRARLVKDPQGGFLLNFEREGQLLLMPPIKVLPNQLLEQLLSLSGGTDDKVFEISGVVTRFEGRNYLLLQRVTPVADMGNLH